MEYPQQMLNDYITQCEFSAVVLAMVVFFQTSDEFPFVSLFT